MPVWDDEGSHGNSARPWGSDDHPRIMVDKQMNIRHTLATQSVLSGEGYTDRQTDRETERQTDRQADRWADR